LTPEELARAYFGAVARHDAGALRALFADDAELVLPSITIIGAADIADFYARAFASGALSPVPGPMICEGDRVAVELELHAGGVAAPLADFFTARDGQIARLVVYTGGPPKGSG